MFHILFIYLWVLGLILAGVHPGWAAAEGQVSHQEGTPLPQPSDSSSSEITVLEEGQKGKAPAAPNAAPDPEGPVQLNAVVVTATRNETPVFETPLPVNVIQRPQIQREMPVSMAEIFKQEAGLDASSTGPNIVRPMIRGLMDDRVLVLVDGIRLSEQRGGGDHRLSVDPEQIQRIEVVRGPGSVLWGSDALGGVINIITRKAEVESSPGFRGQFSLGGGVYSTNDGLEQTATVKGGYNQVNLFLNSVYRNTGDINTPSGPLYNSLYRGYTISGGGNITWPQSELDLSAWGTSADIGVPNRTAQYSRFEGETHVMTQATYRHHDLAEYCPEVKVEAAFQRHQRHMHVLNPNPATVDMQIFLNINTWNLQPQATLTWGDKHRFTTGFQLFREDADSARDRWAFISGAWQPRPIVGVIPDSGRTGLGLYLQDEITLTQKFSMIPGVRFDWIRSEAGDLPGHPVPANIHDDTAVSASLGLLYHLTNELNLVANIGRAFRAPTLLERYFYGPHQDTMDIGNPDLKPEYSFNLDMGLKARYDKFQGTFSLFRNEISDYIVKTQTGRYDPASGLEIDQWENIGRALLYGLEAQGEYDLGGGFSVFAILSYVRGKNETASTDLPYIPPLRGNYGCRYRRQVKPDWELWTEFSGLTAGRQGFVADWETPTGGYTVLTWSAGATYKKNLRLNLMVANLANKSYHDHLSTITWINEEPGRNVRFTATWTF